MAETCKGFAACTKLRKMPRRSRDPLAWRTSRWWRISDRLIGLPPRRPACRPPRCGAGGASRPILSTTVALATVRIWPKRRKSAVVGCTENCSEIAERLHEHSSKAQGNSTPSGALGRKTKAASGVAARHRSSLATWAASAVLSRVTGSPFRACQAKGRLSMNARAPRPMGGAPPSPRLSRCCGGTR